MKTIISLIVTIVMNIAIFMTVITPAHALPIVPAQFPTLATVYVGNLSFQAEESDLEEVFAEYGEVKNVYIPLDRETGRARGFAFVDMATQDQEEAAAADLDEAEWFGRIIKVNIARPRSEKARRGRRY